MRPLFLDKLPELDQEFRKEAGYTHRLSEAPENWDQEIGSELHKQLPFISDYEVNVTIDKKDPGRGFAFGYADISNRTERPEVEHEEAGIPHIRVPIVAEDRQVRPFAVFLDGERVLPMNEERVRETLFNPSTFDLSISQPRDPSLVEPLMPPQRSGIGIGGETKVASTLGGESKAPYPVDSEAIPYNLRKYVGTPFLKRAIELEREDILLDTQTRKHEKPISTPSPSKEMEAVNKRRRVNGEKRRLLELDLAESVANKTKTAYKHISDDQWKAMWQSDKIQNLLNKHGGNHKHPEILNALYETASKAYGYSPKVYPQSAEQKQMMMQKAQQAQQKSMAKQQKAMGSAGVAPGASEKKASLLEAIAPTIRETDRDRFVEKVASDSSLRAGFRRSGIASLLVDVMDTKTASASERLETLADSISSSVVTLQKLPGGNFMVKSANVNAFVGGEQAAGQVLPFAEVAEAIGTENAKALQPGQVATVVADPIELAEPVEAVEYKAITEPGSYRVQGQDGKDISGWVFPNVLAWDGEFSPQSTNVFIGDKKHAINQDLVGAKLDEDVSLSSDIPKGEGVFRSADGQTATAPIEVKFGMTDSQGVHKYVGTDAFGAEISVSLVPGLKVPKKISDNEYALPHKWGFTRFGEKVDLVETAEGTDVVKNARKEKTSAVLFYNGSYHIKGGCNLDKVAADLRQDLDAVGAEFILGLLGVDGATAKMKVSEARKKSFVKLSGLKTITPLSERYQESVKTASALLSKLPNLQRDLVKEAAALEDQGTVDKVLALNFINPENLSTFIEYLPELEETSERMAEMVLAGYLGMKEVPVSAVERSMNNMEEVIKGLKSVQNAQV